MIAPVQIRRRLEVQGFVLTADEVRTLGPWLRFTPAMNVFVNTLGTILGSPAILLGLGVVMAVGALQPAHPWDLVYNGVIRRWTGTSALPRSSWRRRLTFALGAVWLSATAWAFASGRSALGYVLGGIMSALILALATVHFCIVSEIVDLFIGARGRGSCGVAKPAIE